MSMSSAAWRRPAVTENRIDQEEKVFCPACRAGRRPRGEQTRLSLGLLTPAVQQNPSQEVAHSNVFCRLQHKKPVVGLLHHREFRRKHDRLAKLLEGRGGHRRLCGGGEVGAGYDLALT